MKILVVHNAYQSHLVGGEDIVVAREIKGLKSALGRENVFEYIISNDHIRPLKLAVSLWGSAHHYKKIITIIKKFNIELVHVHNFFPLLTPSVFAAAKRCGVKVIHTLHNFRWWCPSGILYREKSGICEECVGKKFGWPAVKYACYRGSRLQSLAASLAFSWYRHKNSEHNIDAYFVLSNFQREKLASLIPAEKMLLKPNPIDAPKKPRLPHEKKDFVFVGRLEAAKGINLLLSTWEKLPEHFQLLVIGEGKDQTLQQQYTRPNIRFLGKLSHEKVMDYVHRAKYLVHPSLTYETFGLTMLEALACGTPVIGIDRGTRAEFIQSGKNGFLCQPSQLAEALIYSENFSEYADLCANSFESAKPFYTETVIAKQIALYQQVRG